ncbi:hypothetical protein VP91_00006060 [Candidatus Pelagibacter ubique]|uniref:Uncharacterized protein n=1 Tax=Pelagibacter ubique TaxID=198252 RepID=A0ABX1T027_PELUQ|nr:hypothetical protein [Candidatus Pelagibacter ubique]
MQKIKEIIFLIMSAIVVDGLSAQVVVLVKKVGVRKSIFMKY